MNVGLRFLVRDVTYKAVKIATSLLYAVLFPYSGKHVGLVLVKDTVHKETGGLRCRRLSLKGQWEGHVVTEWTGHPSSSHRVNAVASSGSMHCSVTTKKPRSRSLMDITALPSQLWLHALHMKDVNAIYVVDKRRKVDFFRKSGKEFCLEFRLLSVKI
jgi:hypothetical protein